MHGLLPFDTFSAKIKKTVFFIVASEMLYCNLFEMFDIKIDAEKGKLIHLETEVSSVIDKLLKLYILVTLLVLYYIIFLK